MKRFIILISIFVFGCKPEPEFYINGKPYYTETRCVKDHTELGMDITFSHPEIKTVCDSSVIDTLEIKPDVR